MSTSPWTTVDRLDNPDSPFAQEAIDSASYILWLLSGRKFGGVRTTTEVYCQDSYGGYLYETAVDPGRTPMAYVVNGEMRNTMCGDCGGCAHTLRLRGTPIISIDTVSVKDSPVSLDDVIVHDYTQISPASGCWGSCENLTVGYTYGTLPPAAGVMAATELANQYLWAMTDDPKCSLPQRVTSVSRQGVSWTLIDQQDFLDEGRTGVYAVDLFLRAVNPYNAKMRPRVFSPDLPKARTQRTANTVTASKLRKHVPPSPA